MQVKFTSMDGREYTQVTIADLIMLLERHTGVLNSCGNRVLISLEYNGWQDWIPVDRLAYIASLDGTIDKEQQSRLDVTIHREGGEYTMYIAKASN